MKAVRILLISTYELGRQPFGLASPAAWLRAEGHEVALADVSRAPLPAAAMEQADLVAFFLPMHTATRLLPRVVEKVRAANARAHLCAYGLYAPLNQDMLRLAGVATIIGGEFEQPLVELARRLGSGAHSTSNGRAAATVDAPLVSLARQRFLTPDRTGLPPLEAYAQISVNGGARRAGYTEASRGCKHVCRHCPVVPVYGGQFRIVQRDIVLEDIRRQVAAGAEHITFGDPDFFNGPGHALPLVQALHREWPALTYDVTIKIEHLLEHRGLLPELKATGCVLVTSAAESFDDGILEKLAKGHTRAGFREALRFSRSIGLPLSPTFIPFTPWTTRDSYREFLRELVALDLVEQTAPIQLAIRLLIPHGSLLLELPDIRGIVETFDARALCYPWRNPDARLDAMQASILESIRREERRGASRSQTFRMIWDLAECGPWAWETPRVARAAIPYLTEPWYC
jgi:radical SAM superfamily enzyme YgiQ (UPF0313 family)